MGIYTKYGDAGFTKQIDGQRVPKAAPRLDAVGTVDELNSHLGLAACEAQRAGLVELVDAITVLQNELFNLGAELAATGTKLQGATGPSVETPHITRMETQIDDAMTQSGELKHFILPGGSELSARLHVARTICRRAERSIVVLRDSGVEIRPVVLQYLNRASDVLFAWARAANASLGIGDILWQRTAENAS